MCVSIIGYISVKPVCVEMKVQTRPGLALSYCVPRDDGECAERPKEIPKRKKNTDEE